MGDVLFVSSKKIVDSEVGKVAKSVEAEFIFSPSLNLEMIELGTKHYILIITGRIASH
jgi:2-keto-3-deoxy-6-phosphogluconate aldolase